MAGGPDPFETLRRPIRVVGHDQRAGLKLWLEEVQDAWVEALGTVEQNEVDRFGQIVRERLEGIALPQLDQIRQTARREVLPRSGHLRWLELGGDDPATSVVAQTGREVKGRDAKRGPELDDR